MQASDLYSILPPGFRYRELWLPELINNHATLPSLVSRGHRLTNTGARKGTTCDGLYFPSYAAADQVSLGVIHNAQAKFWVSFRWKPMGVISGATTGGYFWGKYLNGTNYIFLCMRNTDGKLAFIKMTGGATTTDLRISPPPWSPNQWYHIIVSVSDVEGTKFIVTGVDSKAEVTDLSALPNGGAMYINDYDGSSDPVAGTITDVFMGTDDLTSAERTDLSKGIPPADAVHAYLCDEGRGATLNDRSGGNNGTLAGATTWAWGRVKQPVLSFDGINDYGASFALADISGSFTMAWAGKVKSSYSSLSVVGTSLYQFYISASNRVALVYLATINELAFSIVVGGVEANIGYAPSLAIDDYLILIATFTPDTITLYAQGYLVDSGVGLGALPSGGAEVHVGMIAGPVYPDVSRPLFISQIEGVFTARQALAYTKSLVKRYDLPIAV